MNLDYRKDNDFAVVTLCESRLDSSQVDDFKDYMTNLIDDGDHQIILDLSQLQFMDSSGLGAVVAVKKHLMTNSSHTSMALASPQAAVNDLLDLTCMDKLFSIFPSVGDALKK